MSIKSFRSPSTGEPCTCAQYVAEIMCQRMATKNKEGTLGYKFWNNAKWKKVYIRQVALANKLAKQFGDDVFARFINSKQGKNIYSLGQRNIASMIESFENSMVKTTQVLTKKDVEIEKPIEYRPRKSFGKNTLLDRIRKIDGC